MGGLIVTETVFNIPGVARFLVEAIRWRDYPIVQNLVMFIAVVAVLDQLPGRSALRGARSAHQIFWLTQEGKRMASIDIVPGPADTVRADSVWSKIRYHAASLSARRGRRRHHAGVRIRRGLCRFHHRSTSPISDQFGDLARAAEPRPLARRRSDGPRHLQPDRLRRAHLARGGPRLDVPRLHIRRRARTDLGLSRRLGRSGDPAHRRCAAGGAAAGAGAGDGGGARAGARQHHRRHRDPADPLYRARHPLQHADACANSPSSRRRAPSA